MNRLKAGPGLILTALAVFLTSFFNGAILPASAAQPEEERVRVGFFAFDGYHMVDGVGKRSGYGYDYLQYLSRYTNFVYDYVGYENSWSEMQDMLEAGEIDLLTSAQKTKERMERFDFSDQPIGESAAILTVKAGNDRYMVDDYSQLSGIRVGMLQGNSRNESFVRFAGENGFTFHPVYYKNDDELSEALQEGNAIDAVVTSNLRKIDGEWIVAAFDRTPFYIMVQKGNSRLLDQINQGISLLQNDHKDLQNLLFDRYYSPDNGDEIAYTAEERQYIKDMRAGGQPIRVTINSGREPVAYYMDGEARGIIPEIAKEVLHRTGLPYVFVETPPTVDARELLRKGEAQARFDGTADFNDAETYGLRVTDTYLELPISCVMRKKFTGQPKSVAVIKNSDVVEEYVEKIYDESVITRYDSASECLDSVLSGKQDAAFFQSYIAQKFVNGDDKNRLREQLIPGYSLNFAVSVDRADYLLFSILDKALSSMSQDEINRIVLEQTSRLTRHLSLIGYLYENPIFWLLLLLAAASLVIILVLSASRQKNLRLEREKTREFERFISYVCRANDSVIELDPAERKCRSYQVEEGMVLCREKTVDESGLTISICGLHPADREDVERMITKENTDRLIADGGELYFECRVKKEEDEDYRWFSYTLQGVPPDEEHQGRLMYFIKNIDGTKREETQKRQALLDALKAAQQANEARGAFLSRMSHEIRTPLNAIIGYLTLARSGLEETDAARDGEPQAEVTASGKTAADAARSSKTLSYLEKSDFAAHQLLKLINEVLDLSAIESGKMKIAHEEFNIRLLISGLTSVFHTQAAQKNVKFRVKLNGLSEEILTGDELRLNQILMNLLANAVKFTPSGGKVIFTVIQKAVAGDSVYLQFIVEDTGIGMSRDYKERLFQPFEQQDAGTAQKFGGTGLGLSIAKNLVSMMDGTIEVWSEEGIGTRFTVNLAFDAVRDLSRQAPEVSGLSGLRMLVLYDESSDHGYIRTLLERLGIAYDLSLNGEDALRKIEEKKSRGEKYDVCLLDWDIPNPSGGTQAGGGNAVVLETARRIVEASEQNRPIFLAAAYETPEQTQQDPLIANFLPKPIFQSSLFDALSGILYRGGPENEKKTAPDRERFQGERILLAEDNPLNMEIAKEILTGCGLTVDGAKNGREAAELFEQSEEGTWQAILMDIQMPVLNGYEAARRIRACGHPQAKSIPIIALTADAFAEDVNRALAAGMDGHVAKPVDYEELCRVLAGFLSDGPG